MGKIDEVKQNVEGKVDEIVGDIQMKNGDVVKGGITKAKGEIKQATAPMHDLDDDREDERE